MKIYLDIDGVLIDTKEYKPMPYLKEFLTNVCDLSNGEVYWLSTHTHDGENTSPLNYFKPIVDSDIYLMLEKIKPSKWYSLKTEGIDLDSEFLWFDDVIFQAEYNVLKKINKEHCLIKIENNLDEITEYLKEINV
jgi:hypothetical protein